MTTKKTAKLVQTEQNCADITYLDRNFGYLHNKLNKIMETQETQNVIIIINSITLFMFSVTLIISIIF